MKIDISKQFHQDNLKSEVYHQFKIRFSDTGMALICEYRRDRCRFDLVAYDISTCDVIALIEVRRVGVTRPPKIHGRKHIKYSEYGTDICYISEFSKIPELLDELEFAFYNKKKLSHVL